MAELARCPDCGTELASGGALAGLCPQCLYSLALQDSDPGRGLEDQPTLDGSGRILGERYQMRELLGRGGMGEVWRAFDLKLRVDVALKALRPDRAESEGARELLRREVRSAREVVSPNVCRIFDLVVEDGQELVSMEFIDGTTLAETLRARGPLQLQEAREMASQFLSGLEAIHQAGLVHRDFKPENVMLTRAGRVVVMDFGLAKGRMEGKTGTISGTPAYMSPEQARGEAVDARADVFAAGVVLAEMLAVGGEGIKARQALWRAVREVPPQVSEGPWAPVLKQALAAAREVRYDSARALARALEEVTLRLPGFEQKHPYPGLASFTEEDAEYFFGREVEVEAVWKKLKRPRLLALIGPSGAGKSSFLRAGLLPTLPKSWTAVISTPGSRPFQALARALVPEFSGDTGAMQDFLRFDEADTAVSLLSRWRHGHEHALVIVDQFEELFTQNPSETQLAFAQLLGRLVLEADVHVLLSLRDDFLFRCHAHEALAPILSELTLLGPLNESGLRRALVQPALACGYRYEDESLVDEMVRDVGRERGALPLLAFAASRLWEKRDRERGLLTREAYQEIGGVAGALAQHAEATLESIGTQRTPLVRELFRNLVTAQGTRAAREREELLSVFEATAQVAAPPSGSTPAPSGTDAPRWSRKEAGEVLDALIDARLLTSYERAGQEEGTSHQEVEIIHESLLGAWPRLERWLAQDAEGALLRDQLRQSARLWEERGRPDDLLWRGTAYREYRVWRERYSGGLSDSETAFARAMVALATRQRRRQRLAAAAIAGILVAGLAIVGGLWRRAVAEARHREAAQLLALGQQQLEKDPSGALAYALASLERNDNDPARRFAVEALWRGASQIAARDANAGWLRFSPDGQWLATSSTAGVSLFSREGGPGQVLSSTRDGIAFTRDSRGLVLRDEKSARVVELPGLREIQRVPLEGKASFFWTIVDQDLVDFVASAPRPWSGVAPGPYLLKAWPLGGGEPRIIGHWNGRAQALDIDPVGRQIAWLDRGNVLLSPLAAPDDARVVGRHEGAVELRFRQDGRSLVSVDPEREVRLWALNEETGYGMRSVRILGEISSAYLSSRFPVDVDPRGRFLAATAYDATLNALRLWDLAGPPGTEPLAFLVPDFRSLGLSPWISFDPAGTSLAMSGTHLRFWPLTGRRAYVFQSPAPVRSVFSPDGRFLVAGCEGGRALCSWPLTPQAGDGVKMLTRTSAPYEGGFQVYEYEPTRLLLARDSPRGLSIQTWPSGAPLIIKMRDAAAWGEPAVGPGRIAWSAINPDKPDSMVVRMWDLATGAEKRLDPNVAGENCAPAGTPPGMVLSLAFLPDGRLLTEGFSGLRLWDVDKGTSEKLGECVHRKSFANVASLRLRVTRDGRHAVSLQSWWNSTEPTRLTVVDLARRTSREITSHGDHLFALELDPSGRTIVTGDYQGLVRVGPLTGEEPHLLYGHSVQVDDIAVSPDGRWIVSDAGDHTVRLWPMPDGQPFHSLRYDELLTRLRKLTNLRVVPDPVDPSGYRVDIGPFPGWKEMPTW